MQQTSRYEIGQGGCSRSDDDSVCAKGGIVDEFASGATATGLSGMPTRIAMTTLGSKYGGPPHEAPRCRAMTCGSASRSRSKKLTSSSWCHWAKDMVLRMGAATATLFPSRRSGSCRAAGDAVQRGRATCKVNIVHMAEAPQQTEQMAPPLRSDWKFFRLSKRCWGHARTFRNACAAGAVVDDKDESAVEASSAAVETVAPVAAVATLTNSDRAFVPSLAKDGVAFDRGIHDEITDLVQRAVEGEAAALRCTNLEAQLEHAQCRLTVMEGEVARLINNTSEDNKDLRTAARLVELVTRPCAADAQAEKFRRAGEAVALDAGSRDKLPASGAEAVRHCATAEQAAAAGAEWELRGAEFEEPAKLLTELERELEKTRGHLLAAEEEAERLRQMIGTLHGIPSASQSADKSLGLPHCAQWSLSSGHLNANYQLEAAAVCRRQGVMLLMPALGKQVTIDAGKVSAIGATSGKTVVPTPRELDGSTSSGARCESDESGLSSHCNSSDRKICDAGFQSASPLPSPVRSPPESPQTAAPMTVPVSAESRAPLSTAEDLVRALQTLVLERSPSPMQDSLPYQSLAASCLGADVGTSEGPATSFAAITSAADLSTAPSRDVSSASAVGHIALRTSAQSRARPGQEAAPDAPWMAPAAPASLPIRPNRRRQSGGVPGRAGSIRFGTRVVDDVGTRHTVALHPHRRQRRATRPLVARPRSVLKSQRAARFETAASSAATVEPLHPTADTSASCGYRRHMRDGADDRSRDPRQSWRPETSHMAAVTCGSTTLCFGHRGSAPCALDVPVATSAVAERSSSGASLLRTFEVAAHTQQESRSPQFPSFDGGRTRSQFDHIV